MYLRRIFTLLKFLILFLALIFVLLLAGINLPFAQRFITKKANGYFHDKNLPVQVDEISLLVNGKIGITRLQITSKTHDTIIFSEKIRVSVRIIPLLSRKVKVKSLTLQDATVHIGMDASSGKLDLVSLFAGGKKPVKKKERSGKKWDISVKTVFLKNVQFSYHDDAKGIRINQYAGKINLLFDRFSLISRQIFADQLKMENIHGELFLRPHTETKTKAIKKPATWKFRINQSDLRDVLFTLQQPDVHKRMDFSLGSGDLSNARMNLQNRQISVDRLMLREPGALISSVTVPVKTKSDPYDSLSLDFPGPWNIKGKSIKIHHGSFRTQVYPDVNGTYIKQSPLQITSFDASLKNVRLSRMETGFIMNKLALKLENGFQLNKGSLAFQSDSTRKSMLKADLRMVSSRIELELEAGNELSAIIKSYHNIPFLLNIKNTELSSRDIIVFFPHLKDQPLWNKQKKLSLEIHGQFNGTVDILNIGNLTLNSSSGISLSLAGRINHILKPSSAICSLSFTTGTITRTWLTELVNLTGKSLNLPDIEPVTLQGHIEDRLTSPVFSLNIQSRSGNITSNGFLDLQKKNYSLKMNCSGLELGKITGIRNLGQLSASIDATGHEFRPDSLQFEARLTIDSAVFKGYNYRSVILDLNGDKGIYAFRINASDTSFRCDLAGTIDPHDTGINSQIKGHVDVDAGKLNLAKGISFNGNMDAAVELVHRNLTATASINNLELSRDNISEQLEALSLYFQSSDTLVKARLTCDFMQADMHIKSNLDALKNVFAKGRFRGMSLVDSTLDHRIPYLSILPAMEMSLKVGYDPIMGLLISDSLLAFDKINFKLIKDSSGITTADLFSDQFHLGANKSYGTNLHFESFPERTVLMLKADRVNYRKIQLSNPSLDLSIKGDTGLLQLIASDNNMKLLYDLSGAAYKTDRQIIFRSTQPQWIINGYPWNLASGDLLFLDLQNADITADLHLKNDQRAIDITGKKSEVLNFNFNKVDFNMLMLPGMNPYNYEGELNGKIEYQTQPLTKLIAQLDINKLRIPAQEIGHISANVYFQSDTLGNLKSELKANLNDTSTIEAQVRYKKNDDKSLINASFSNIRLSLFESLVKKYVSGLHGELSGGINIAFAENKPQLDGNFRFTRTALKIVPLNARFQLPDDLLKLENNRLVFNEFLVLDSLNKKLMLNGTINLNDLANITADMHVAAERFQVMNTTEKDNAAFNGSIFVNSGLTISGPVQKPSIEGNIILAQGTVINYRFVEDLTLSETEKAISFTSFANEASRTQNLETGNLPIPRIPNIKASIEIDPNSLFTFEISRGYQIGVKINGGGFLNYSLMPDNSVNLSGTYEIRQGTSELKIPGWPRKDFTITPGSSVKWNGRLDDPELNIETTSKVRGSYTNPVDGQVREINFLVYMELKNKLSQLEILFDVHSNDQYITSVLNTMSKDERMKQAINLLIFQYIELPNMVSSSDYVSQQINQFWESQLNQFTKAAIKNVDLSFGIDTYKGASKGGGEQEYTSFSYEVKKDVLNKRGSVLVSGRMNDNGPASGQTNNMIENFIFEYSLDTFHSKYLKIYRQQNYEDLLEGEVTKSGVGFIYRKNYDRLRDIWRRKKKKGKADEDKNQ